MKKESLKFEFLRVRRKLTWKKLVITRRKNVLLVPTNLTIQEWLNYLAWIIIYENRQPNIVADIIGLKRGY